MKTALGTPESNTGKEAQDLGRSYAITVIIGSHIRRSLIQRHICAVPLLIGYAGLSTMHPSKTGLAYAATVNDIAPVCAMSWVAHAATPDLGPDA